MRTKKDLILKLLNGHRLMTLATNRPDGWPQATMVGYVNDGFLLYCFVARNSQKYVNIKRDPRVSIAIGSDAAHPVDIKGLSLAGKACEVTDPAEFDHVARLRLSRYPEYADLPPPVLRGDAERIAPQPPSAGVVLLRIAPEIFSVLDYSRGFGHSDLVTFSERDLDIVLESRRHRWDGNGGAEDGALGGSVAPTTAAK
ncbi:MAG: pyridoxamine 5'-phosphate oxidase family protein [Xanthobacteraceae bacterium]